MSQLTGSFQASQRDGITTVGLDSITALSWSLGWSDHRAKDPLLGEMAVDGVAAGARLIDEVQRPAGGGQLADEFIERGKGGVDLTVVTDLTIPAIISGRDIVKIFSGIE